MGDSLVFEWLLSLWNKLLLLTIGKILLISSKLNFSLFIHVIIWRSTLYPPVSCPCEWKVHYFQLIIHSFILLSPQVITSSLRHLLWQETQEPGFKDLQSLHRLGSVSNFGTTCMEAALGNWMCTSWQQIRFQAAPYGHGRKVKETFGTLLKYQSNNLVTLT